MCKLKIYIAGPMRGYDNYNRGSFYEAQRMLENKGVYTTINPCDSDKELGISDEELDLIPTLKTVMARDLSDVCSCDAIYMLHGWEYSEGARVEHSLATMLHLVVLYQ